jgi:acetylornithine/LysW-gamma-L-lysine aminotransferase
MGEDLAAGLESTLGDTVRDIRGEGLIMGVEVKRNANTAIKNLALEEQVLTLPAGRTVIRLLPPLIIGSEHVERTVEAMATVIPDATEP